MIFIAGFFAGIMATVGFILFVVKKASADAQQVPVSTSKRQGAKKKPVSISESEIVKRERAEPPKDPS